MFYLLILRVINRQPGHKATQPSRRVVRSCIILEKLYPEILQHTTLKLGIGTSSARNFIHSEFKL